MKRTRFSRTTLESAETDDPFEVANLFPHTTRELVRVVEVNRERIETAWRNFFG
jgi:hypothetical protein